MRKIPFIPQLSIANPHHIIFRNQQILAQGLAAKGNWGRPMPIPLYPQRVPVIIDFTTFNFFIGWQFILEKMPTESSEVCQNQRHRRIQNAGGWK